MKVLNIHTRIIQKPKQAVSNLLVSLSTEDDLVWPREKWPAMRFEGDLKVGAKGGHGPIRYTVEKYNLDEIILFRFTKPKGFYGIHKIELKEISPTKTEIKHTIDIKTKGKSTFLWVFAIRPLHNALIEDCFDKVENKLTNSQKLSKWNFWVTFLRNRFKK